MQLSKYEMTEIQGNCYCDCRNWHVRIISVFVLINPVNIQNNYRLVFNIRRAFAGNKIVEHSEVVGASPIGAAPTTSTFSA